MNSPHQQQGLTLVELMVALVVGLILTGGVLTLFVNTVATHNQVERVGRLEEELAAVMDLMVRDIRRAGYDRSAWDYAISGSTATLVSDFDGIAYQDLDGNGTDADGDGFEELESDCILYHYDKDFDGTLDADEYLGFKLDDNVIQKRKSGNTDAADCDDGNDDWESVTSTWAASITDLDFDVELATVSVESSNGVASTSNVIQLRAVTITIAGQQGSGADQVDRTLTETVRLRNDQMNP